MEKCCNRLRLRAGVGVDENLPTPTPTPTPVKTNDSDYDSDSNSAVLVGRYVHSCIHIFAILKAVIHFDNFNLKNIA